ncbi:hypothetical protein RRG08_040422 [Elysia crispata]|uniref:Uncharacterized protein n=1 Tax=Elysia crispata TaxID=231223 RepID=A0AAE0ZCJ1_9GAST|nr:hypothetical protein RRG08_040422 [Elysia crispata]
MQRKLDIFIPHEYVTVMKISIQMPFPYEVVELDWDADWQETPTRLNADPKIWIPMFEQRLRITRRKYEDLQEVEL